MATKKKQKESDRSIEKGGKHFDGVRDAITTLLQVMQANGAPLGSTGLFNADGADVCVIVATGPSAEKWRKVHEMVEGEE